ncbi:MULTISPECIES: carbohydrate porin [unclassified Acinetobacter]|uniref:carbohydrate porin n=1 Tax=unclassified Acinetobacter TaxID=196816 RepID=UPI00190BF6E6|nr:carbohydrate porin [Acinetobacter sp. S55]MBK0066487.1 carbohydrate porin [Acinetobacter sp. S54]
MKFSVKPLVMILAATFTSNTVLAFQPFDQDQKWILGDWKGKRNELAQQGYQFTVAFQNESAINLQGGYNDSQRLFNANQWAFATLLDLEKIASWNNTQANITITKRDGQSLSNDRISDPRDVQFSSTQEIYGRGQSWRLSNAWIKKGFSENRLQIKFGRMGLSDDFNASHCEFQNLMLCGGQLGKTVGDIWFNSPVSQWGINAKYQFLPTWWIGAGIYEVNPENALEKHGFNLDMEQSKGALIPMELIWKPKLDVFHGLAGEYKIGAFISTAEARDVKKDENGEIQAKVANRKWHDSKHSIWLNAQQQLIAHSNDPKRGLFVSANFTFNDKATTVVETSQQLAFWYKGAFDQRPNDSIGLGFAHFDVNERVRERQNATNQLLGLIPEDYRNPQYSPLQHNELNIELNYNFQWSPAISLRPNIQYVYQPSGVKEVNNAWVAGLTMKLNF